MKAFGLKALSPLVGRDVSILYRWEKAIRSGQGIRDHNKRALIAATEGTPYAIAWGDFDLVELEAAA